MTLHKNLDFSQLGGFPFDQSVFAFMQEGYSDLSEAVAKLVGNNVIITGVENSGSIITSGWIVYNNELIPFKSGTKQNYFQIKTDKISLPFFDQTQKQVKSSKYATPATSGVLMTNLTRIKTVKEISNLLRTQLYQYYEGISPTNNYFNVQVIRHFYNSCRVEGVFYPYSEDLVNGTAIIKMKDFPYEFAYDDKKLYTTAHFRRNGVTFCSVCEITPGLGGDIFFKALTAPPGNETETWSCFVVFSNEFELDIRT